MKIISFPEIQDFDIKSLREPLIYIGAAGFEDRALAVLNEAKQYKKAFEYIIGIEYEPRDTRNRKEEFQQLAREVISQESNIKWVAFDRKTPGEFNDALNLIRQICSEGAHICLDISAMSKILILILLDALRDINSSLTIAYTEARVYHPVPEEFERDFEEAKQRLPKRIPEFLTSGVYGVVTTPALSSIATQGYPTALVEFPTFNHNLFLALLNEVTPQELRIIEGEPLRDQNKWRLRAVRTINEPSYSLAKEQPEAVSTFHYDQTIKQLEKLYEEYQYTHEFVIASTCSKLQTVGVFFFKQMHPDTQIVYPTPKGFFDLYTEGIEQIHQISFPNYHQFIETLDGHRYFPLEELGRKINIPIQEPARPPTLEEKASA